MSVFVDDLLLCGTDEESRRILKAKLEETFRRHSPVTWNETVLHVQLPQFFFHAFNCMITTLFNAHF